jgi:hypothetical protein
MSRVTEAGMDGALEGDIQRVEQRAVGERETRWSVWGAFIRSGMVLGGDAVLVDESAEPVVPADRRGWRHPGGRCWPAALRGSEAERAARPMAVVVADELA